MASSVIRRLALQDHVSTVAMRLHLERASDPMFLTDLMAVRFEQPVVLADPPVDDGRSYAIAGEPEPRCRPYLRVIEAETGWLNGPQLRFERRDDGMYLTVKLEESVAQRIAGARPFDVRVSSLAIAHGPGRSQLVPFTTLLVTPLDDPAGPAFRVEAEAKVPLEQQEQLVRDLRGPNLADWVAVLELDWLQPAVPSAPQIDLLELLPQATWMGAQLTDPSGNVTDAVTLAFDGNDGDDVGFVILSDAITLEDSTVRRALRMHPKWVAQGTVKGWLPARPLPQAASFQAEVGFVGGAVGTDGVEFIVFEHHTTPEGNPTWNEVLRQHKDYTGGLLSVSADLSHLAGQDVGIELRVDAGPSSGRDWAVWVDPRVTGLTDAGPGTTQTFPIERRWSADYPESGRNAPIYAAVTGNYAQARWQSSQHGWFQPTPLRETVYCLPDAYRLEVDEVRGLPSVQALLLRKDAGGQPGDALDPSDYRTRLTLRAVPYFTPGRMSKLRELIRLQSGEAIRFAELAIGGYKAARFVADDALAGLGDLFAGSVAGDRATVDPIRGFSLTYDGDAEFIDLIYTRLKEQGIGGEVEFDLDEPGDQPRHLRVPAMLTLRRLAPLALPFDYVGPQPGNLSRFVLRNPTQHPVTVGGLLAYALQTSPVTGSVHAWFPATAQQPLAGTVLAPGQELTVDLGLDPPDAMWNGWDVELSDTVPQLSDQLVLSELFDAATSGVRGWKVEIDSPPLQFFTQLSAAEQAAIAGVVRIEVEVRRPGSPDVEEASLTRDRPQSHVLLSRTVADFLTDRATGRSTFQWRRRLMRTTSSGEWSAWSDETGNSLSVYTA